MSALNLACLAMSDRLSDHLSGDRSGRADLDRGGGHSFGRADHARLPVVLVGWMSCWYITRNPQILPAEGRSGASQASLDGQTRLEASWRH